MNAKKQNEEKSLLNYLGFLCVRYFVYNLFEMSLEMVSPLPLRYVDRPLQKAFLLSGRIIRVLLLTIDNLFCSAESYWNFPFRSRATFRLGKRSHASAQSPVIDGHLVCTK